MARQYQDARWALSALDPTQKLASNWGQYFLPLNDHDLRAPTCDEAQPSEGQTQYAWIWITPSPPPLLSTSATTRPTPPASLLSPLAQMDFATGGTASDVDSQDFDRIQWAKCQARAKRFKEEVQLTVEEMG